MIREFFLFCAGVDTSLINGAEYSTERVRYNAMGALVFLTAVFAAVFTGFTVSMVAPGQPWVYIPAALLWSSFIFCLDRYIVMSIRKSASSRRQWGIALPRMVVAAFIGVLISHPFEMFVFNPEITKILLRNEQARINTEKAIARQELDASNAPLNSHIEDLRATNKQLNSEDTELSAQEDEAHKRVNAAFDPVSGAYDPTDLRIHYKNLNAQKAEKEIVARNAQRHKEIAEQIRLNNERIREYSGQLVTTPDLKQIEAVKRRTVFGLLDRLEAMHQLAREDITLGIAMIFMTLFFMTIEVAPAMVKISSERGPYDDRLEQNEVLARQRLQEQMQIERAGQDIRISEQENILAEESRVRAEFMRDVLNSPEVELELERLRPLYAQAAARQIAQNLANEAVNSRRDTRSRPFNRPPLLNQIQHDVQAASLPNPVVGNDANGNHSTEGQFGVSRLDQALQNVSDPNIHTPQNNRPSGTSMTPPVRPHHDPRTAGSSDLNQRIDSLLNGMNDRSN